jgi:hypothetical protein
MVSKMDGNEMISASIALLEEANKIPIRHTCTRHQCLEEPSGSGIKVRGNWIVDKHLLNSNTLKLTS